MDQGWEDSDHFWEPRSAQTLLPELLDHCSLLQVLDRPKFAVHPAYPSFDEHTQKRGEENDPEARKEERVDSDGIRRWGEDWSNVWLRCSVLHDEGLVEEDALDGVEGVCLQESECLDDKCGEEGGKECGLDCRAQSAVQDTTRIVGGRTKTRMTSRRSCHSRSRSLYSAPVISR